MKNVVKMMLLIYFVTSCSSINEFLQDRNLITAKEKVTYRVINKEEIKKEEPKQENKELDKESIKKEIVKSIDKVKEETKKEEPKDLIKEELKKESKEIKEEAVNIDKSRIIVSSIPKQKEEIKIQNKVENKLNENLKAKEVENKNIEKSVVVEEKKELMSNNFVFTDTDEKIIEYISEKVVESKDQIKSKTKDSLNKLAEKGIKLTPKEFLALAYDNIKKTNVNSYILAAARVINTLQRGN